VTGGGSALHGLVGALESQIGLPVLSVSPLTRLDTSRLDMTEEQANEVSPVLSAPIGLALSEPDKTIKKFNLLPPQVIARVRMRKIQERTLVGCVAVLVLFVGFGAIKFLQVHNAQSNVNQLQASITSLNAQVPKYDQVVAANDAYTAGVARRASVLSAAIDWPVALNNLISITPATAQVQTFNGQSLATGTTAATTTSSTGGASATKSAAIGTIQLGVTGPGPSLSISEAWINSIAGSQLFANPLQGATTVNADSTISFPFTISITPTASLEKNASLK